MVATHPPQISAGHVDQFLDLLAEARPGIRWDLRRIRIAFEEPLHGEGLLPQLV